MTDIASDQLWLWLDRFLTSKTAAGLSPRTIRYYHQQVGGFLLWLDDDAADKTVSRAVVEGYLIERRKGRSPATVSAAYRALRAFFGWVVECGYLTEQTSPMHKLAAPRVPKKLPRYVTPEEFDTLYGSIDGAAWLDYRDRTLLLLLFWSGLRRAEVMALTKRDLNLKEQVLLVRAGKGDKSRLVPFSPKLEEELNGYLARRPDDGDDIDALFVSNDGNGGVRGALSDWGLASMLRRRCGEAGVRKMNPHAFRHGFAMNFLNGGMNISAVASAMGHSSVQVTEGYYARWLAKGLQREYGQAYHNLASA